MASANYPKASSGGHAAVNQRVSDIKNEPITMLSPIEGYESNPILPLEISVESLETMISNIARNAWIAKERTAEKPSNDLTQEESAAIHLYTMEWKPADNSLYALLNAALRAEDRDRLVPYFFYLKLFLSALWKLPSVKKTVWRGVKADLSEQYSVGKAFVWWGFSSCTESLNVLESEKFLGKTGVRTLFNIECEAGKEIHQHSYFKDESEILLLPATQFQVLGKINPAPDLHIIHIRETKPRYVLLQPPFPNDSPSTGPVATNIIQTGEKASHSSTPQLATKSSKPVQSLTSSLKHISPADNKPYENQKLEERIRQKAKLDFAEFRERHLTDHDMRLIADELTRNTHWKTLSLAENDIGNVGASHLAHALKNNTTLINFYLDNNRISDIGATELAAMLQQNTTLWSLYLSNNEITDSGMASLAVGLKSNSTLRHISLGKNKITDKSIEAIADLLIQNKTLFSVNLAGNAFSEAGKIQNIEKHIIAKIRL
ncbi:unnamed protein product [Rotaria sp. Silwood2]|nr:unnamed protein product [Rotaria sp. Silwood2]CAF2950069.1 unnamed protein product [Rotaria sp. Silwood2]CAF3311641.1 unnamed protein product [Rotaria sp. Silwood2]CAF3910908.1 unnamed protein product [Rotaria sp. Silwood2]CAF4003915.1 unnamed protein product [Rotaria sp. Silwood2]